MLLFCSCARDPYKTELKSSDIAARVIGDKSGTCDFYVGYGYETDSLTEDMMVRLYGSAEEAEYCVDYAAFISRSDEIWEAHFFRVGSLYDMKRVEKMLMRRVEMINKEEIYGYMGRMTDIMIAKRKNMVCLFITDNNEGYKATLDKIC